MIKETGNRKNIHGVKLNSVYRSVLAFNFLFFNFFGIAQVKLPQPDLKIKISLDKYEMTSLDQAEVTIELSNTSQDTLELLFDKPSSITGGLWYDFNFELEDSKRESVLATGNRRIYNSTDDPIVPKSHLKEFFYRLAPGAKISRKFLLLDLVSLNGGYTPLKDGLYSLQLKRGESISNTVLLSISNTVKKIKYDKEYLPQEHSLLGDWYLYEKYTNGWYEDKNTLVQFYDEPNSYPILRFNEDKVVVIPDSIYYIFYDTILRDYFGELAFNYAKDFDSVFQTYELNFLRKKKIKQGVRSSFDIVKSSVGELILRSGSIRNDIEMGENGVAYTYYVYKRKDTDLWQEKLHKNLVMCSKKNIPFSGSSIDTSILHLQCKEEDFDCGQFQHSLRLQFLRDGFENVCKVLWGGIGEGVYYEERYMLNPQTQQLYLAGKVFDILLLDAENLKIKCNKEATERYKEERNEIVGE